MLKSAAPHNHAKRVTFQSLGLDRCSTNMNDENEMVIEQNSTNSAAVSSGKRRGSCGAPASAARVASCRSTFSGPPDIIMKEDVCMIYTEGLPELPGNSSRTLLRFSNNSYYSATPTERFKTKSMSRSGRQTPLPPSGLQSLIEPMDLGLENDEVGGSVIEEDEQEDDCHAGSVGHVVTTTHHVTSLTDLGNAPPLVDLPCDELNRMEVSSSGEKRKPTPPDLLALSQMYFERNQIINAARENSAAASTTSSGKLRKFNSADSSLTLPSDRNLANLGIARPRKLTPLANRPPMLDVSAQAKENGSGIGTIMTTRHALHLPVKYSAKCQQQPTCRQNLDPLVTSEDVEALRAVTGLNNNNNKKGMPRKGTFIVSTPKSSEVNSAEASDSNQG